MRIFYAWQSDLPDETNRRAIRSALREAANKCSIEFAMANIYIDEATRDEPGSPNIPLTIQRKIEEADILIADVTTVSDREAARRMPNPNVVFELGYGVAHLGWGRVILLFNTEYGTVNELPFDFDRHRASPYSLSLGASQPDRKKLSDLLHTAIRSVLVSNPKRPAETRGLSFDELRRNRDIENLKWILSALHIPTLDEHVSEAPAYIHYRVFHFFEGFSGIINSSLFSLYDKTLEQQFRNLYLAWDESLSYAGYYADTASGEIHAWSNRNYLLPEAEQIWERLKTAVSQMRDALAEILGTIRDKYVEINLRDTNDQAWFEYV